MTTPSDLRKPHVPDGSEKLIQAGAVSYIQATIAMNEFQRIVQDECEKLALERLDDINRIMGTNFTDDDLHHWPQKGKLLNTQDPLLSQYFNLKDIGYIYIGLYWEARRKFDEKRDLKLKSFPYKDKDKIIALSEAISDEEAASFPEKVQSVLEGFLGGWEKIGGLKKLMEDQPKAR
jgi:hypothetical protein